MVYLAFRDSVLFAIFSVLTDKKNNIIRIHFSPWGHLYLYQLNLSVFLDVYM